MSRERFETCGPLTSPPILLSMNGEGAFRRRVLGAFPARCRLCALYMIWVCTMFGAGDLFADGRWRIEPRLETTVSYEDNYYASQDNARGVYQSTVAPGVELGYETAKSALLFDYGMEAKWFTEEGETPEGAIDISEQDYVGHDLSLTAKTQFQDRLALSLKGAYFLTRDPDRLDYYSNEITRHKYSNATVTPKVTYRFGDKFSLTGGYTFTDIDYLKDSDEDSLEQRGQIGVGYRLSPLSLFNLEYQYWEKTYDLTTPDYASQQAMAIFKRELKYYTYSIGVGYHVRRFENSSQGDLEGTIWKVTVNSQRPKVRVAISQNYNDTSIDSQYYKAIRCSAAFGHRFVEKVDLSIQGYYQYSDYLLNVNHRIDDTWAFSCKVAYVRNRTVSFSLESGVEQRDSSVYLRDYDNAYIMLALLFNFNIGSR